METGSAAERENPVYEHPADEAGSNRDGIPLGYLSMSCGTAWLKASPFGSFTVGTGSFLVSRRLDGVGGAGLPGTGGKTIALPLPEQGLLIGIVLGAYMATSGQLSSK
ncbi:MAG: hypothetical protein KM310_07180 [Clostridiales bacterium]|nr:hypothetical protein [Clostridiales bacterium]